MGHSTMRNAVSYFKQYRPAPLMSTLSGLFFAVAVAVAAPDQAPVTPVDAAALPGRPSPQLATILTPRLAPPGSFVVRVLDLPLPRATALVRKHFAPQPPPVPPDGAWMPIKTAPLTAFGDTALYDRSRVAQLYVAMLAQVVRAPVERGGRVVGSVTLISPYPDPTLSRLEPGTLLIYFDAEAAKRGIGR